MTDSPDKLEALFDAVVELAPQERAAYLAQACAQDEPLRRRVEQLLHNLERAGKFLTEGEEPVSQAASRRVLTSEKPGDRIGHYKLLEQIGEGGCGTVYMAEQEQPVRRRVALKIIKLGMDTKSVIARFEAERQALALMDHPNIAKVHDAGATETGRPYFVMELVPGIKITEYCDQKNLSPRERLNLFIQVCQAIQHAHQKGVIHRDIKPSNILVTVNDGVALPRVIDFGIAKATNEQRLTDKTLFTAFEQFIGTPAYMSPEQAELSSVDIDTRSDIYSLGVLLYELLTGKTPFDTQELLAAGLDEMRRTIREKEPLRPSTRISTLSGEELTTTALRRGLEAARFISLLRGDLDWIVMKCLEKDRTRRYETANGLAMDVHRHLDNEPVAAGPPGTFYLFQKLVRRNHLLFTAAGAVTLALILGLGLSTYLLFREKAARREQMRLRKQAQTEAAIMEDMLGAAGPGAARGRDTALLREILERALVRIERDSDDQPEVQADVGYIVASTYRDLGEYQKAEGILERVVQQYSRGSRNANTKLALALGLLGATQSRLDKGALGRVTTEKGLQLARRCGNRSTLASCLYYKSQSLLVDRVGTVGEQEPYLREAIALRRGLGDDPAKLATYISDLSLVVTNLEEAEQLGRQALGLHREVLGGQHPEVIRDLFNLAQILQQEAKTEDALTNALQALELGKRVFGPLNARASYFVSLVVSLLMSRGDADQAQQVLQESVHYSPSSAKLWGMFACFEARRQNWNIAADYSSHAVQLDPDEDYFWITHVALLLRLGRLEEYRQYCHDILERADKKGAAGTICRAVKAALLLPVGGPDFQHACQTADSQVNLTEPHGAAPWYALHKALVEYRRGGFAAAAKWANRSHSGSDIDPPCIAAGFFVEAMSCAACQNTEAAREALAQGDKVVNSVYPTFGFERVCDWIVADLLRSEAQKRISLASVPPQLPSR